MKSIIFSNLLLLLAFQYGRTQCTSFVGSCPADIQQYCDLSSNDAELWNDQVFQDLLHGADDLGETFTPLTITAVDDCIGANLEFTYVLFLDLDGDNIQETAVPSWSLPAPGTVQFGNAGNAGYTGGQQVFYDKRPVPSSDLLQFKLDVSANGTSKTATLKWHNPLTTPNLVDVQLPVGSHKIVWSVFNGLGETQNCTQYFTVKDCKNPIVVCLNGLSVNLMPTGQIQLWASDFLQYAEDNLTLGSQIEIAIRKQGAGAGFPLQNGSPQLSVTFDCNELGAQFVEIWARDKSGNADYCQTFAIVKDPMGNCQPKIPLEICVTRPCDESVVTGVDIFINGLPNTVTPDGCNQYEVPQNAVLSIGVSGNVNYLNGVDVLDLKKISRHILGYEILGPYNMLAADANRSGSITSFDILELRKLIVGIYVELPIQESWRGLPKSVVFTNPQNPFQTNIPGTILATEIQTGESAAFYAFKIGDVDCSAWPGVNLAPGQQADDRSAETVVLPDISLKAGESAEIPLELARKMNLSALQFALNYPPSQLEIEWLNGGFLPNCSPEAIGHNIPGQFKLAWFETEPVSLPEGAALSVFRFTAKTDLNLRDVISLKSEKANMATRLYDEFDQAHALNLAFRPQTNAEIGEISPNPGSGLFRLPLHLENAGNIVFQLFDLSGKLLLEQRTNGVKGLNLLEVDASAITTSGAHVYEVQTDAQRKSGIVMLKRK